MPEDVLPAFNAPDARDQQLIRGAISVLAMFSSAISATERLAVYSATCSLLNQAAVSSRGARRTQVNDVVDRLNEFLGFQSAKDEPPKDIAEIDAMLQALLRPKSGRNGAARPRLGAAASDRKRQLVSC